VAHEMGHQFGANHTFNSSTSSCGGGNRNASTASKPGSGSRSWLTRASAGATICSLTGSVFHSISLMKILNYTPAALATVARSSRPREHHADGDAGSSHAIPQRHALHSHRQRERS